MQHVGREAMAAEYELLLGRKTYDLFASSFADSAPDNPVADRFNQAAKYVVTSDRSPPTWPNSVKLDARRDVAEAIRQLKEGEGPLLQVLGSWQLIQSLLANSTHRRISTLDLSSCGRQRQAIICRWSGARNIEAHSI